VLDVVFLKVNDVDAGAFGKPNERIEIVAMGPLDIGIFCSLKCTHIERLFFGIGDDDVCYAIFF
tara:strand:- start:133 stop:324 length:192 start_codon:yes stop_codon:yes gene_type:complete